MFLFLVLFFIEDILKNEVFIILIKYNYGVTIILANISSSFKPCENNVVFISSNLKDCEDWEFNEKEINKNEVFI